MLVFIGLATLLTLFALAVMLPTLWRGPQADTPDATDQHEVNLQIAKAQLFELETQVASGAVLQSEYEARKLEIERAFATTLAFSDGGDIPQRLGNGTLVSVIVCMALPLIAAIGYWQLGTPQALDLAYVEQQNALARTANPEKLPAVEDLLPKLEAHLAQNPDDLKGWRLLGVTYLRMSRYRESINALEKALALDPANPDIMFQLADATALAGGGQLQGEAEALINRALSLRPQDPRGLWMLGMLAHQQGNNELAVSRWETLLPLLEDQPTALAEVQQLIATSKASMGSSGQAENEISAGEKSSSEPATVDGAGAANSVVSTELTVKVSVSDEFKSRVKPGDSVFIYAKAFQGPPMPLAVVRISVAELPFDATLTDAQAMIPAMKLSNFSEVIVGARVSFTGEPIAKSGDLFSETGPIKIDHGSVVSLSISEIVP